LKVQHEEIKEEIEEHTNKYCSEIKELSTKLREVTAEKDQLQQDVKIQLEVRFVSNNRIP
jgi:hypothetical protein